MRQAMSQAVVGDDVMGEDPTVRELEERVAAMMGKEAAVLVSSGTMGNLVSIGAVCERGDEVLTPDKSHIQKYEAGGASVLLGVKINPLPTGYGTTPEFGDAPSSPKGGVILPQQVVAACHVDDPHFAPTRMLCVENTNVICGGNVLSLETMRGAWWGGSAVWRRRSGRALWAAGVIVHSTAVMNTIVNIRRERFS